MSIHLNKPDLSIQTYLSNRHFSLYDFSHLVHSSANYEQKYLHTLLTTQKTVNHTCLLSFICCVLACTKFFRSSWVLVPNSLLQLFSSSASSDSRTCGVVCFLPETAAHFQSIAVWESTKIRTRRARNHLLTIMPMYIVIAHHGEHVSCMKGSCPDNRHKVRSSGISPK